CYIPVTRLLSSMRFFFHRLGAPRDLHSFPTRRSSDLGSRCGGLPGATESERLEPPGNKDCAPAKGIRDNPSTAAVGSATSAMRRRLVLAGLAWGLRTVERESLERMNMSSSLVCR